jgi:MarR family transcriptional regulator, lower aerobic nicotinate degradation pathway regulator
MKKSFELLTALLPVIEEFETSSEETDLTSFLKFATSKTKQPVSQNFDVAMQMKANQLGFFINYLFKFTKGYTKTALMNSAISTIDDFVFLANLGREESIRKVDLIKQNMMEIPSGVEVIKRLIKSDLVSEFDDTEDRRSVRLQITETGKKELFSIFSEMNKVGKVLAGNLSEEEIVQLHGLLEKLFDHHQTLRNIDFSTGLDVLLT